MKKHARILLALTLFALCLATTGCNTWLCSDAPKLWQTNELAGLKSRGQDYNYLRNPTPEAHLGGW